MTGHWVYRFKDGTYLSHRRAPRSYALKEETLVLTLAEARVFNSPSAAANAGNYPGKYGRREAPRGEAVRVRVVLDRVEPDVPRPIARCMGGRFCGHVKGTCTATV